MSNNPFLKSKESNNRFSSLQDEDKSSFKESSNKSNRKNIEYEASQNSFKQSSKPEINRESDSRFNRRHDNFTKSKPREPSPPPLGPDATDLNLFPELTPNKENNTTSKNEVSTKFKDILKINNEEKKPKENLIPPGWVRLSLVNRKTLIEYGAPTPWMIKQQHVEELQNQLEEDPNYIMFQAIEAMKKNWQRYEQEYDDIHGEGAYAERFRLPPVYGPEYDTESEVDTEEEEDEC